MTSKSPKFAQFAPENRPSQNEIYKSSSDHQVLRANCKFQGADIFPIIYQENYCWYQVHINLYLVEDSIYLNLVQDFFHKNRGFDPFEKYNMLVKMGIFPK